MSAASGHREPIDQLWADRATEGLDPAGERRLEVLLAELGERDDDGFDRAAAAVDLAFTAAAGPLEALPVDLAVRIAAAARTQPVPQSESSAGPTQVPPGWPPHENAPARRPGPRLLPALGWVAAAAACAALTFVWRDGRDQSAAATERLAQLDAQLDAAERALAAEREASSTLDAALLVERQRSDALAVERDLAATSRRELVAELDISVQREIELEDRLADLEGLLYEPPAELAFADLLANPPADLVRVPWSTTGDPLVSDGAVAGEVIWSDSLQTGFMVFDGMPVNSVADAQYQLWIFSSDQKESTPVDGGVFDAAASDRLVIPIDAKLGVRDPSLFAVTLEKPGGVVVSDRERLLLAASL